MHSTVTRHMLKREMKNSRCQLMQVLCMHLADISTSKEASLGRSKSYSWTLNFAEYLSIVPDRLRHYLVFRFLRWVLCSGISSHACKLLLILGRLLHLYLVNVWKLASASWSHPTLTQAPSRQPGCSRSLWHLSAPSHTRT